VKDLLKPDVLAIQIERDHRDIEILLLRLRARSGGKRHDLFPCPGIIQKDPIDGVAHEIVGK
jgi:hypothetical protein